MPVLPYEYQMIKIGKRFLLFDSGLGDINRMFIFATNDGIDMLVNSSQWYGDGTFKLCGCLNLTQILSHYLLHFKIIKKAFFQNTSKHLLLIESWDFIAWPEVLFYSINQKSNDLSDNQ